MSDSIFDLKQSLFTSNLPVPPPRDRSVDHAPGFDQALHSAQRHNRDNQRANNTPESERTENNKPVAAEQTDAAPRDDQDEVTLSQLETEATSTIEPEAGKNNKLAGKSTEDAEDQEDPTAAEIAAAANTAPTQPVIKTNPTSKDQEQHDLRELNDAVQPDEKRGRAKQNSNEALAANATNKPAAANVVEPTTATDEQAPVEPTEIVIATELLATNIATASKTESAANKHSTGKSGNNVNTKQAHDEEAKPDADSGTAAAAAIRVTSETDNDPPASKRRQETTRQSTLESHDKDVKLAAQIAVNVASSLNESVTTTTPVTADNTAKTPEISANTPNSSQTPLPPNHLRGPQIPNSFANRLEAASAERKANDGLNGVDRARFVQRVASAFQRTGENEGEIRLRLSPPELGALKLEVTLRDGALVARMETETAAAKNLLLDNLPQLKERLAEQNVRIQTFEVEVRDQTRHDSADDAQEQQRQQQEQQRNRLRGERATTPVVAAPIVRTLPAVRQSSQLNVVI